MNLIEIKNLREQRNAAATAMRELITKSEKENRGFTNDEETAWDKALKDIDAFDKRMAKIDEANKLSAAAPNVEKIIAQRDDGLSDDEKVYEKAHRKAFREYLTLSPEGVLSDESRKFLQAHKEKRAFTAGTANTGGNTVPQGFYDVLDVALKACGSMYAVAEQINTDKGNLLPYPTFNYTGVAATIVGEGTTTGNDSSTPFGVVNLNAYTYRSPMLPVSIEFLDDTAFDEGFIYRALIESIARGTNAHFTTGTGTSQPKGIVTAAAAGKVGLTGQTLTVIYDDLIDLITAVDPSYRTPGDLSYAPQSQTTSQQLAINNPSVGFMMKDLSMGVVRKIKDSQNLPIWLPSYQTGIITAVPDRLLGYPVYINQDMATMAANAKSILFGRLDKYKIRKVKDVRILRLVERYADNLQVGFNMFLRADGNLIDAGTHPVAYYQNSAT